MENKHFLLTALCVLATSWSHSQAAPFPAPWQFSQDSLFDGASAIAQSAGQLLVGDAQLERGDLPRIREGACYGQVHIFDTGADNSTLLHRQTLSRADAGLSCSEPDLFGRDLAVAGNLLVVSAPGLESLFTSDEADTPAGEILIYRRASAQSGGGDWQFQQRITGEALGSLDLGLGIATDGTRIYAFNRVDIALPGSFGGQQHFSQPQSVVTFLADADGLFREDSRVEPPPFPPQSFTELAQFSVTGDQLLLQSGQFLDYLVRNDATEEWQFSQRLTGTEAFRLSAANAQISGEYLITNGLTNDGSEYLRSTLQLYRRSNDGRRWQVTQSIAHPIPVAPPFTQATGHRPAWALNKADLVVAWPNNVPTQSQNNRLQSQWSIRHYRLNSAGQFSEVQQLTTLNSRREPQLNLDGGRLSILWQGYSETRDPALWTLTQFSRADANNFAIDRGISGGWWFGPQRNGQGLGLEVVGGNRLQMAWVTHDQQGEQMWLFGVGQIDVDRVRVDLVQPVGGRFGADFDPATVQRQAWGQVELIFSDCHQGQLNYRSPLMGEGSLPLFRLTPVDGLSCDDATASPLGQRWNGSWFDPSHNGEGVMMHVTPTRNGPRLSTLWMTYHPDGRQAVLYSAADLNDPDFAFFDSVIRPTGPSFLDGNLGGQLRSNPWGSFDLDSARCGQARLDYVSSDPGFGSGRLDLVRFATPLGNRCSQ